MVLDDYSGIEDNTNSKDIKLKSEDIVDDAEFGQKRIFIKDKNKEDIYLVPTINYDTYKDESAAKKRVSHTNYVETISMLGIITI